MYRTGYSTVIIFCEVLGSRAYGTRGEVKDEQMVLMMDKVAGVTSTDRCSVQKQLVIRDGRKAEESSLT